MKRIYITAHNAITPLGFDMSSNWQSIKAGQSGIGRVANLGYFSDFYASRIDDSQLAAAFSALNCTQQFTRLQQLMILSLNPIIQSDVSSARTALVFSTTKGDVKYLEQDKLSQAALSHAIAVVGKHFGFVNAPIVVSNACVSGALALVVAQRLIQMNQFDQVYVVAADELSEFVISGFNAFQAMSPNPCKPYDANRSGVSLGEAATAVYVSSKPDPNSEYSIEILGGSSINDANHISGPSRTGEGLYRSIQAALKQAKLQAAAVDFICAHGTATAYNDEMEAIAFNRCNMQSIPLHSLKGFYGHTLGASGLLETAISMESLKNNLLIPSLGYDSCGISKSLNITTQMQSADLNIALKTASGFGGSNTALILKKVATIGN